MYCLGFYYSAVFWKLNQYRLKLVIEHAPVGFQELHLKFFAMPQIFGTDDNSQQRLWICLYV